MKVVFSMRAYVSLLSETAEKVSTETGGIFLGQRNGDIWYVIESIDPGPKSIFQPAYFEYDQKYVTHLTNKMARIYKNPLQLIGLWHRHPGSFCQFSGTDDGTNQKFASLHKEGAISALVNIDPNFRLTIFHVSQPLCYQQISYEVNDNAIPRDYLFLNEAKHIEGYLSGKERSQFYAVKNTSATLPKLNYSKILTDILSNLDSQDITEHIAAGSFEEALDDSAVEEIIAKIEVDMSFLSQCQLDIALQQGRGHICLYENGVSKNTSDFYMLKKSRKCILVYKNRCYLYTMGMLQAIIEDVIKAIQTDGRNFKLNREFVECSILRLRKK